MQDLGHYLIAALLISLRIVPALAFSPPFTLMRLPAPVKLLLCLALSAWIVGAHPDETSALVVEKNGFWFAALGELAIGLALALPLQLAFAAILTAGRAVDLQAGYAFAMIADPSSRSQSPLIGMLFAYAAAALFFTTEAPSELLGIWSLSVEHVPLGAALSGDALTLMVGYAGTAFLLAFGAGGLILLVLFLIDSAIALMSRTLPQMNVLFLGFQVKALATLAMLPIALAASASLYLRMFRLALDTMLKVA